MKKIFEVQWEGSKEVTATELQNALGDFASDNDTFKVKRIGDIIMDNSEETKNTETNKEQPEDILGMGLNFNKGTETKEEFSDGLFGTKERKKDGESKDMLDNLRGVL